MVRMAGLPQDNVAVTGLLEGGRGGCGAVVVVLGPLPAFGHPLPQAGEGIFGAVVWVNVKPRQGQWSGRWRMDWKYWVDFIAGVTFVRSRLPRPLRGPAMSCWIAERVLDQ